jgi:hypothetical protein
MNCILEVVPAESTMQGSLLDSPFDHVYKPSQRQVARNAMHDEIHAE